MDLKQLHPKYGQSIWLDYIRRHLLTSGELARLVREDGLRGVTSNPSIFQKAIAGSTDYEQAIAGLAADLTPNEIYEQLAIEDIQHAADILRPVYDESAGADGFVSMEVSPRLAHDREATLREARRLWQRIARPNLMIKVPATDEGIPAIAQLLAEGIHVNVTLLFSRAACARVTEAYMSGLEQLADPSRIASVASVFVSRLDTLVDPQLREHPAGAELIGEVGIANAKLIYRDWKAAYESPRWQKLAARGAHVQRLLWASTSMKDPRKRDVAYVEALIGPDTVDTMPPATLDALRDHGEPEARLGQDLDRAAQRMAAVAQAGIDLEAVTAKLLDDGVRAFVESFDAILVSLEQKRAGMLKSALDRTSHHLPGALQEAVNAALEDWRAGDKVRRLWARDVSLWTGRDEAKWLDWLDIASDPERVFDPALPAFVETVRRDFDHAVVLGMGGSSLCPDVLARTFGKVTGYPQLHVLDSTDPAQIRALEGRIAIDRCLFIVSSKSGTTLEPNILNDYFYARVRQRARPERAGAHFVAVTDPGSAFEQRARAANYARIFAGVPGIGGRYSALSNFGMVPAAIMGLDLPAFVDRTLRMVHACASCVPPAHNPGVVLGVILGTLAQHGRDKLTLVASPAIVALGAWLEQLLAESTGKQGKGLIPIDREPLGAPASYAQDRLFVYLRLDRAADPAQDAAIQALEAAGQPVVRIELADALDLGQEFFRWEIATAVAGSILGIHPFDQPDVESSKVGARKLTDAYEASGVLPAETPFHREGALALFADETNRRALERATSDTTLAGFLRAHLDRIRASDYVALLAYVEQSAAHDRVLQTLRQAIRERYRVATCAEFGPRFLHSTGQAYKGGPNTGVFVQLTWDDPVDLPVPGRRFSFGVVEAAQARGDLAVLVERGRRALRVHLGSDPGAGLETFADAVRTAIAR